MTDHNNTGATARPWSYEIQYGPNGEKIYAWVYYHNLMVCTMKVHHARLIVEAVNAYEPLKARLAEVEGQRAELASKLSHLVDSLKHAEARALDAEIRLAEVERERDDFKERFAMADASLVLETGAGIDTHETMLRVSKRWCARAHAAEARVAVLEKALERIANPSELATDPMNFGKFPEAYLKFAQELARATLAEQKEAGK